MNRKSSTSQLTDMESFPERVLLSGTLFLSFAISFGLYLFTLAPTVTFEDSGELIAAAYRLGIPHQPGYPLFTLLGRLFSMLPINNVAYRLNLMSAFLTSAGALWLCWMVVLVIEDWFEASRQPTRTQRRHRILLKYAAALSTALFMTTAFETWEQSIITEVYGLNAMFTSLLLLLAVQWKRQTLPGERLRYFLLICYVLGLTLSNHTTALMFIPVLFIFAWMVDKSFILRLKNLFMGIPFLLFGLLPYAYLPLASARDPIMDWGNPENWTNFWRTVQRHQYNLDESRSWGKFVEQLGAYIDLLIHQWQPFLLLLALAGLIAFGILKQSETPGNSGKKNPRSEPQSSSIMGTVLADFSGRPYFYLSLVYFFFAAPLLTYMTNFDVSHPIPHIAAENKALVSVFYIPSYIYIAILMGVGIYFLLHSIGFPRFTEFGALLLIVALPLVGGAYVNFSKVTMRHYYFTEEYVENLFTVAGKKALIFAHWDPFYFPTNYYQFVEGKRPDIIVLDQQLLRRSWYLQWLTDHYPEFIKLAEKEVKEFLEAVAPFEAHQPYDGNFIQQKYMAMINAFIDRTMEQGREVYFTYTPPPDMAAGYLKESVLVAYRLKQPGSSLTDIDTQKLHFESFFDDSIHQDRMARVFYTYYGKLFLEKGSLYARAARYDAAVALYLQAARFFKNQPVWLSRINTMVRELKREALKQEESTIK